MVTEITERELGEWRAMTMAGEFGPEHDILRLIDGYADLREQLRTARGALERHHAKAKEYHDAHGNNAISAEGMWREWQAVRATLAGQAPVASGAAMSTPGGEG